MKALAMLVLLALPTFANEKPKSQPYWQKMGRTEIYRAYERPCIKKTPISGSGRYNPRTVRINVPYRSQLPKYILKKK